MNAYEVKEGDILLSSRGTAIKIAIVPALDKKAYSIAQLYCYST
ncbi:hypothetical protein OL548_32450 [Lysinibacillus sp. MHQ-1]|nr:hypothetical protein OL548_32450 [Lysinibacillus sp. MHQ-1]